MWWTLTSLLIMLRLLRSGDRLPKGATRMRSKSWQAWMPTQKNYCRTMEKLSAGIDWRQSRVPL